MALKKIVYPKSLKDIPLWRQNQIAQDLLWFSRFSPVERLRYIVQEWKDIQTFINKFGLKKRVTRKRSFGGYGKKTKAIPSFLAF
jgi:hypothetical protein